MVQLHDVAGRLSGGTDPPRLGCPPDCGAVSNPSWRASATGDGCPLWRPPTTGNTNRWVSDIDPPLTLTFVRSGGHLILHEP